jgi:hypothetical protein
MLVLAPDPRLGIAPERVTRVRGLLDESPGTRVPGVVVALPGGADGVLDAVVLRPDGVLGLAALSAGERENSREAVAAGGGLGPRSGAARSADAGSGPSARQAADELDRLLGLPDPACAAPRRVLGTLGEDDVDAGAGAARAALKAPVGSFRVIDVEDLRRLLLAFRLGDHMPDDARLAEVGFLAPGTPALLAGASPETAPVAVPADEPSPRTPLPATGRLPSSAPESSGPPAPGSSGPPAPGSSGPPAPGGRSPGLPAPGGAIGGLLAGPRRAGRAARGRYGGSLPDWVWGWRGLTLAAVAAFLVALGLAFLVGRAATGGDPQPDPSASRTIDGITFTRQVATTDVSCEGHAYGQAAAFLRERGCLHLDRSLWSGTADGRDVVVAVATVQMPDTTTAGAFRSLVDSNGTGNISDLLREQRGYPGAPEQLTGQGYASAQLGDRVVVAEADGIDTDFTDGEALDRISRAGLALR